MAAFENDGVYSPHDHREYVAGCYRCALTRHENKQDCTAYDGWGDFTCDLPMGHHGPHRDSGAPWAGEGEQRRWLEVGL